MDTSPPPTSPSKQLHQEAADKSSVCQYIATDISQSTFNYLSGFPNHWQSSTSPEKVSLFGFRRFRTSQLLNIRFLEDEISALDREIYQAGLQLPTQYVSKNHHEHVRRDPNAAGPNKVINETTIHRLRTLLKQYSKLNPSDIQLPLR